MWLCKRNLEITRYMALNETQTLDGDHSVNGIERLEINLVMAIV